DVADAGLAAMDLLGVGFGLPGFQLGVTGQAVLLEFLVQAQGLANGARHLHEGAREPDLLVDVVGGERRLLDVAGERHALLGEKAGDLLAALGGGRGHVNKRRTHVNRQVKLFGVFLRRRGGAYTSPNTGLATALLGKTAVSRAAWSTPMCSA